MPVAEPYSLELEVFALPLLLEEPPLVPFTVVEPLVVPSFDSLFEPPEVPELGVPVEEPEPGVPVPEELPDPGDAELLEEPLPPVEPPLGVAPAVGVLVPCEPCWPDSPPLVAAPSLLLGEGLGVCPAPPLVDGAGVRTTLELLTMLRT